MSYHEGRGGDRISCGKTNECYDCAELLRLKQFTCTARIVLGLSALARAWLGETALDNSCEQTQVHR